MDKAKAKATAQVLRNAARIMEQGRYTVSRNSVICEKPEYPCWCIADANGRTIDLWAVQPETAEFLAVFSDANGIRARSHEYLHHMRDINIDCTLDEDVLALCFAAAVIESGGL